MISSNHLAWPATLSHEFHPVVLWQSSVTSGWFIANCVEPCPAFIQRHQEIAWYLFAFAQCCFTWILICGWERQWTSSICVSRNFLIFLNSVQFCVIPEASCFLFAHLLSFTFCPFSKCCGCCSFSWAILSLFWGFFPNEWRLNLEAFQNRATVADSEKMFVFGLCIHFVTLPEKFWTEQFAMTSQASPLPAFSKMTLSVSFWVVKYKSVSCSPLFLLQFKWALLSLQMKRCIHADLQ